MKYSAIIQALTVICNCAIGIIAVIAIQQSAVHFEHWQILFFMILPLLCCTSHYRFEEK